MRLSKKKLRHASGFTIMELMIATIVFGVVLLGITTAILQLTRVYYKGVTEANVQNTARTVVDLISQGIQFSGNVTETPLPPHTAGTSYAFCIGSQQYSYQLGYQLSDNPSPTQKPHALVVRELPSCSNGSAAQSMDASIPSIDRELLAPNMRLSKLQVDDISPGNLYKVSIRVVYGDDDLLCSPSAGDCSSNLTSTSLSNDDVRCKNFNAGTQFCAVSDITTTVVKRVQ